MSELEAKYIWYIIVILQGKQREGKIMELIAMLLSAPQKAVWTAGIQDGVHLNTYKVQPMFSNIDFKPTIFNVKIYCNILLQEKFQVMV